MLHLTPGISILHSIHTTLLSIWESASCRSTEIPKSKRFEWFPDHNLSKNIITHNKNLTFWGWNFKFSFTWVHRCFDIRIELNEHRIKSLDIQVSSAMYPILRWQIQKLYMLVDFPTLKGFPSHVIMTGHMTYWRLIYYINNIEHSECFLTSHKIQIKITWLKLP